MAGSIPTLGGSADPAAEARAASMVGRVIDNRYRVDEVIAIGGMGAVYRAFHLHMRKEVAIKVLHPQTEGFPELVARFEREAVAGAHITHPNVATAHDFGTFEGESRYLVMESIHGTTVRDLIDGGAVPQKRAIHIVKQLLAALDAAHQHGIVHRDLKPRNVMVTDPPDDRVKLIDFGFARVPADKMFPSAKDEDPSRRSITQAGAVFGTISYMAPETALGMRNVDARSDLFAVGILFFELLTGKHPFPAPDAIAQFTRARTEPAPAMAEVNPDASVAPELEAVVRRLLEKDPAERFQTAADALAAIDATEPPAALSSLATPLPVPVAPAPAPPVSEDVLAELADLPPPPKPKWPLFVALNVIVLGAIGGWVFLRRDPPPENGPSLAGSIDPPLASSSAPVPSASASASPSEVLALRLKLLHAAEGPDVPGGAQALLALADADPNAFWDHEVKAAASTITSRAATRGGDDADRIFYVLAYKLGSDGLDVLYDVIATGKSTRGSSRAKAMLAQPDVRAKATPAMAVAFDVRRAVCQDKARLFPKAGEEGDERVAVVLESLRDKHCDPTAGHCCYKHDEGLDKALAQIRSRMK